MDLDPEKVTNNMEEAALQAKMMQDMQPQQPPLPAGTDPNDPTGAGGGTIGTGVAPTPGEQGFTGVPQDSGQANTQQAQTVGDEQPPMGSVQ